MYTARITREHRTAFVILCDRSGSMAEMVSFGGETVAKAEAVASIINMFIEELILRCRREDGVRDYFDIALLEYGGGVTSLLSSEGTFTTLPDLAARHTRTRNRHLLRTLPGGNQVSTTVEQRCWIEPRAQGDTPMAAAFRRTEELLTKWCSKAANRNSFPPMVLNITDGEASDAGHADLFEISERIRQLSTLDGNVLFFNIHLCQSGKEGTAASFPSSHADLPNHKYAKLIYDMSSRMPGCFDERISAFGCGQPPFRAMAYNCPIDELYSMLSIGSVSAGQLT